MPKNLNERASEKIVRVFVCGSVDDGKSTLIGRLVYELGGIYEDRLVDLQTESGPDWSLLTDGLRKEREQAITVDVSQQSLAFEGNRLVLIDTPGHDEFLRNLVSGAAGADAAMVVVDSSRDLQERTRMQLRTLALLGLENLLLVVNKIDLPPHRWLVVQQIAAEASAFAESLGLGFLSVVPVAAREGLNFREAIHENYPSLLEALSQLIAVATTPKETLFRAWVQGSMETPRGCLNFGRCISGSVDADHLAWLAPSILRVGRAVSQVQVGDVFEWYSSAPWPRGSLLSDSQLLPKTKVAEIDLLWFANLTSVQALNGEASEITHRVRLGTQWTSLRRLDFEGDAGPLQTNECRRGLIEFGDSISCDAFRDAPKSGVFLLVHGESNETLAVGFIRSRR